MSTTIAAAIDGRCERDFDFRLAKASLKGAVTRAAANTKTTVTAARRGSHAKFLQ
jgi:hypothetical protein